MVKEHRPARKPGPGRRRPIAGEEYLVERPGTAHLAYDFSIEGHRFRGSAGTADREAAAQLVFALRDREWRRLKLGEQPAAEISLAEACAAYYEQRGRGTAYGDAGQRFQMARMVRILGPSLRLSDLDDRAVSRLMLALRAGEGANEGHEARSELKPASCNRYLATLSVICRWARETQNAAVGPWTKTHHTLKEPEPRETYLLHEQAGELLGSIVPHARPIVFLDLLTGLRKNNVTTLTWDQVDLQFRVLRVRQKGDRPLSVPLTDKAAELLARVEPDPKKRVGPIWWYGNPTTGCACAHCVSPLYRGQPILDWRRSFRTAARKIGMPTLRQHDLRHTVASWVLDSTGDIHLVRDQLGHKRIETTLRYAHRMPGKRTQGIEAATAGLALPAPAVKKASGE
ncbi:MAG: hypothetical protein RIR25_1087 [Verrucomicrobiota bacterium]